MTEMKRIIREDYERKVKKFEKMCDQDKTIIIGDSMVAYFNLNTFGLVDQMINQGIAGDTTLGVLDRLYLITKLNPKKVIVSVGSNDMILTDLTLDETVKNILTIKKEIESNAKTKVYIMSLTPVLRDSHVTNHDYVLWRTNKEIEYINNQLKKS